MRLDGVIVECVRRVVSEFGVEWDDCYQQAYMIALEKEKDYNKEAGASFETYMHHKIYGGLRDYARRYLIRESSGMGKRVLVDDMASLDTEVYIDEDAIDAKTIFNRVGAKVDSVSRDILRMMIEGYAQTEIAEALGITQQAVSKRVQVLFDGCRKEANLL
jgi:RNA polymerase sigma factor (sigma-70 family)